ncbi:g856 [Coccomyxa elongata]
MHPRGELHTAKALELNVVDKKVAQEYDTLLATTGGRVGAYHVDGLLDRGTMGLTVKAMHFDGTRVVIKLISRGPAVNSYWHTIDRMVRCQQALTHPHIVRLVEVFVAKNYLAIVSEFVEGDSVSDYLDSPGFRTPARCRAFFQQLIMAIEYCHSRGIAIRSLKSDALLLDVGADGSPSLKISYFGYAKHDNSVARTIATPLLYIAPEVLGYGEYDVKAADMWSCGAILCDMFTGSTPNLARTNWNINAVLPQLDIPQEAKNILARLMIHDPTERATATEILQEPWITQGLSTGVMQMNDIARQNSPQQLDMDAFRLDLETKLTEASVPAPAQVQRGQRSRDRRFV